MMEWHLMVLVCTSLMTSDVKHCFILLFCHIYVFLCSVCSSHLPVLFFNSWVVCFLISEFSEFFMYSGNRSFIKYVGGLVTKLYLTFATLWTVAHQIPLSMGFPRQEYWNVLPFPSPGDLPDPGIELGSPALQADSSPIELQRKPHQIYSLQIFSPNLWLVFFILLTGSFQTPEA